MDDLGNETDIGHDHGPLGQHGFGDHQTEPLVCGNEAEGIHRVVVVAEIIGGGDEGEAAGNLFIGLIEQFIAAGTVTDQQQFEFARQTRDGFDEQRHLLFFRKAADGAEHKVLRRESESRANGGARTGLSQVRGIDTVQNHRRRDTATGSIPNPLTDGDGMVHDLIALCQCLGRPPRFAVRDEDTQRGTGRPQPLVEAVSPEQHDIALVGEAMQVGGAQYSTGMGMAAAARSLSSSGFVTRHFTKSIRRGSKNLARLSVCCSTPPFMKHGPT